MRRAFSLRLPIFVVKSIADLRLLITGLCALLFALCLPAEAQQPAKVRKIGFLNQTGAPAAFVEAFRQGIRELGYIEGQNIVIEYRSAERGTQLTELATELVQEKVEVIVAAGPGAPAAKKATETIPIVFTFSGDPIEAGFIDSLARPGRNMTGITWLAFELVGKRLEILKEAVPRVSRVAVLGKSAASRRATRIDGDAKHRPSPGNHPSV